MSEAQHEGRVTPEQLVVRFCGEGVGSDGHHGWRPDSDHEGAEAARGGCGYVGGRGDSLVTGFDDGYDFMEHLTTRGWRPMPEFGDWPYVVWLHWPEREGAAEAVAQYVEGDLLVWRFADHGAALRFVKTIPPAE